MNKNYENINKRYKRDVVYRINDMKFVNSGNLDCDNNECLSDLFKHLYNKFNLIIFLGTIFTLIELFIIYFFILM